MYIKVHVVQKLPAIIVMSASLKFTHEDLPKHLHILISIIK